MQGPWVHSVHIQAADLSLGPTRVLHNIESEQTWPFIVSIDAITYVQENQGLVRSSRAGLVLWHIILYMQ